ncbi:hypothetical protein V6N13_040507 [Hibiscus sabdariffa]
MPSARGAWDKGKQRIAIRGGDHTTGTEAELPREVCNPDTRLKGVVLNAKHVADTVLFLASQDSEVVTGHDLVVDGDCLLK